MLDVRVEIELKLEGVRKMLNILQIWTWLVGGINTVLERVNTVLVPPTE